MYCRNCGKREGVDGVQIMHTLLLCEDCAKLTAVSHCFDPATGASLVGIDSQYREPIVNTDDRYWEQVRQLIREEIEAARFPGLALANPRRYRRIEQRDEDGTIWRGTLYQAETEPTKGDTHG